MDSRLARSKGMSEAATLAEERIAPDIGLDFERLYRSSRDDVFAYAVGLLRDRIAAEDVTAAAFKRAYRERALRSGEGQQPPCLDVRDRPQCRAGRAATGASGRAQHGVGPTGRRGPSAAIAIATAIITGGDPGKPAATLDRHAAERIERGPGAQALSQLERFSGPVKPRPRWGPASTSSAGAEDATAGGLSAGVARLGRGRHIERSAEIGLLADPADVAADSTAVFGRSTRRPRHRPALDHHVGETGRRALRAADPECQAGRRARCSLGDRRGPHPPGGDGRHHRANGGHRRKAARREGADRRTAHPAFGCRNRSRDGGDRSRVDPRAPPRRPPARAARRARTAHRSLPGCPEDRSWRFVDGFGRRLGHRRRLRQCRPGGVDVG